MKYTEATMNMAAYLRTEILVTGPHVFCRFDRRGSSFAQTVHSVGDNIYQLIMGVLMTMMTRLPDSYSDLAKM